MASSDQLSQVKRSISKDSDVFRIIGKPHGIGLCPSEHPDFKVICEKDNKVAKIWRWSVVEPLSTMGAAYGAKKPKISTVGISFDKDGDVLSIQSSSNNP